MVQSILNKLGREVHTARGMKLSFLETSDCPRWRYKAHFDPVVKSWIAVRANGIPSDEWQGHFIRHATQSLSNLSQSDRALPVFMLQHAA